MQISEFQAWVDCTDRDTQWYLLTTLQLLSHLTEEVGELAQSINRIYGYAGEREEHRENIGRELADVLWFLVKIANKFGVDLDCEIQSLVKRANEWPSETIAAHHCELVDGLRALDNELTAARTGLGLSDKNGWHWQAVKASQA
jgi:NTP pyrophosphatase (non-canonical NTP hydrolase)